MTSVQRAEAFATRRAPETSAPRGRRRRPAPRWVNYAAPGSRRRDRKEAPRMANPNAPSAAAMLAAMVGSTDGRSNLEPLDTVAVSAGVVASIPRAARVASSCGRGNRRNRPRLDPPGCGGGLVVRRGDRARARLDAPRGRGGLVVVSRRPPTAPARCPARRRSASSCVAATERPRLDAAGGGGGLVVRCGDRRLLDAAGGGGGLVVRCGDCRLLDAAGGGGGLVVLDATVPSIPGARETPRHVWRQPRQPFPDAPADKPARSSCVAAEQMLLRLLRPLPRC